jgi:hypothetical protein
MTTHGDYLPHVDSVTCCPRIRTHGVHSPACGSGKRLVLRFEGTVEELRDWLVQLADDVETRRWEMTGTRVTPAQEDLGVTPICQACGDVLEDGSGRALLCSCEDKASGVGACMDGHQTERPCSGELYCPQEESCDLCGTVEPNGGLMTRWESGRPVGQMCAYRFGCLPGHQRPRNG